MPTAADIEWLKETFQTDIEDAIAGTPFTVDLIVALACQETGHIWSKLRRTSLTVDEILALCVGDTLDAPKRGVFPKTRQALLAEADGDRMFAIARQALEDMARHVPGFPVSNPNKFCHGYGMFQYDLQFFRTDPDYFLERRYEQFPNTLGKCLEVLRAKAEKIGLLDKPSLTDLELTACAIAYNTGTFKPDKGLKQGHFNGTRFYGEEIFDFIRLSKTVSVVGPPLILVPVFPGEALIPPPTPVTATGRFFVVDTQVAPLRIRSEPRQSVPPMANVVAQLPDGHPVQAVTGTPTNNFLEIETSLSGAHIRGFASTRLLRPAGEVTEVPVVTPAPTPPTSGVVAVTMPRKGGGVTKRINPAGAHSLNETGMPIRRGTTPAQLCAELADIIAYLAVDKPSHERYQPTPKATFCNIYAHDYCHLAGVYLPRVWWTPAAIEKLAQGQTVEPLIGNTIEEIRANNLFRWLRDFGGRFGWRQTGTLTKLQQEANQGAIGVIVARQKNDGRSGHIVMVVPETDEHRARRNGAGEVTHPLQSQAGRKNFQYDTGGLNWWKREEFAESAFWLHA